MRVAADVWGPEMKKILFGLIAYAALVSGACGQTNRLSDVLLVSPTGCLIKTKVSNDHNPVVELLKFESQSPCKPNPPDVNAYVFGLRYKVRDKTGKTLNESDTVIFSTFDKDGNPLIVDPRVLIWPGYSIGDIASGVQYAYTNPALNLYSAPVQKSNIGSMNNPWLDQMIGKLKAGQDLYGDFTGSRVDDPKARGRVFRGG
jgi:hypothetical protein